MFYSMHGEQMQLARLVAEARERLAGDPISRFLEIWQPAQISLKVTRPMRRRSSDKELWDTIAKQISEQQRQLTSCWKKWFAGLPKTPAGNRTAAPLANEPQQRPQNLSARRDDQIATTELLASKILEKISVDLTSGSRLSINALWRSSGRACVGFLEIGLLSEEMKTQSFLERAFHEIYRRSKERFKLFEGTQDRVRNPGKKAKFFAEYVLRQVRADMKRSQS
jgi:hypothetical protein